MSRFFPIIAGVLLIVGLTLVQAWMADRLANSKVSAEQRAELLEKIPKKFGDWQGEDKPVDPLVMEKSGAVGVAVSRGYFNSRTGERVDLWLIVGHARDIAQHTPDICFPGSGFEARAKENGIYPFVMNDKETLFLTNTFFKEDVTGRHMVRVFWNWFNSDTRENNGQVVWEAPQNARWHFGNSRALFKMYFTSEMRDTLETAEQSACIHFARDFMPEVDKALKGVYEPSAEKKTAAIDAAADKPEEKAAADAKEANTAAPKNGEQPADKAPEAADSEKR